MDFSVVSSLYDAESFPDLISASPDLSFHIHEGHTTPDAPVGC